MPRTLDPILEAAMDSGSFNAYFKVYFHAATIYTSTDILKFKIYPLSLEVTFYHEYILPDQVNTIKIERGIIVNGTTYTTSTSLHKVTEIRFSNGIFTVKASMFPREYTIYANANQDYQATIEQVTTALGYTAVFADPTETWLTYQFFPTSTELQLEHASLFPELIRQKYFIFATDNGDDEILYRSVPYDFRSTDHQITDILFEHDPIPQYRRIRAVNSAGVANMIGDSLYKIHDLGFLDVIDLPVPTPYINNKSSKLAPHLKYLTLDKFDFIFYTLGDGYYKTDHMQVIEEYNPSSTPSWNIQLLDFDYYND